MVASEEYAIIYCTPAVKYFCHFSEIYRPGRGRFVVNIIRFEDTYSILFELRLLRKMKRYK
jgi:hypothetical protein